MNVAVDAHVHTGDLIALAVLDTGTKYLTIGSVTLFVSDEELVRIHAATAPVESATDAAIQADADARKREAHRYSVTAGNM